LLGDTASSKVSLKPSNPTLRYIPPHCRTVVSGESARQTFFTAERLDLTEGFKILSGAVGTCVLLIHIIQLVFFDQLPMVRRVTSDLQMRRVSLIHKCSRACMQYMSIKIKFKHCLIREKIIQRRLITVELLSQLNDIGNLCNIANSVL